MAKKTKNAGIISKTSRNVQDIIKTPDKFFKSVKAQKDFKPAFLFSAIILGIYQIFSSIITFSFMPSLAATAPQLGGGYMVASIISGWIVGLFFAFIFAGYLHLFNKLVGAKGKYIETYKAYVYSDAAYLLIIIPLAILFAGLASMSLVLMALGGLLLLAAGIWGLYIYCTGVSVLHGISKLRALGALLIAVIVALVVIIIAAVLILAPLIMTAAMAAGA